MDNEISKEIGLSEGKSSGLEVINIGKPNTKSEITELASSLVGKSQSELEEIALGTRKKLDNKTFDDLVEINYHSITNAGEMIANEKIASVTLKETLKGLLETILSLQEFAEEMYNYNDNKAIVTIKDSVMLAESSNISESSYEGQIQKVQKFITDNYHKQILTAKNDKSVKLKIQVAIREFINENQIKLPGTSSIEETATIITQSILDYDILTDSINQPVDTTFEEFIEEIRIDEYNDIRLLVAGQERRTKLEFNSPDHALLFAEKLARDASGQQVAFGPATPFARFRLEETMRVSVMRDPIATRPVGLRGKDEPVVHMVIRRQRSKPFSVSKLEEMGSVSKFGSALIQSFINYGVSGCVFGGTGTGKTAMFTSFASSSETKSRIITFAEVDEMNLRKIDRNQKIIKKETSKELNTETGYMDIVEKEVEVNNPNYLKGLNSVIPWEVTDKSMVIADGLSGFDGTMNAVLTFSPDSIFLQETKGSEVLVLMEAAVSDHQVWTTVHVKNASSFPDRIVMLAQQGNSSLTAVQIKSQIANAFPILVGCSRYADGTRRISSITEIVSYDSSTDSFEMRELMKYVVTDNKIVNGKLTTIGTFQSIALPSEAIFDEMMKKGLTQQHRLELNQINN